MNSFEEMDLQQVNQQNLAPMAGSREITSSITQAETEAREMATIKAKIFMARQFPREMSTVQREVETRCSRMGLAQKAVYSYKRGGQAVKGASIHLANALAEAMGNIDTGTTVLSQTEEASVVKVHAWDIQSNRQAERTFVVHHTRDKNVWDKATGQKVKVKEHLTDDRDISEMINNLAARNRRSCILELVPTDLQEYAVAVCEKTVESGVNVTPELIQSLLDSFERFGVSKAMVEAKVGRNADAITAKDVVTLREIWTSLRDGMGTVEDFFDTHLDEQVESEGKQTAQKLAAPKTTRAKASTKAAQPKAEPVAAPSRNPDSEMSNMNAIPLSEAYMMQHGGAPVPEDVPVGPEGYGDDALDADF